ncbi:unnamed protein product [Prorocentrum cordatum]|uniref:Uncharacterized protein n=1 Tax=Prorocentrum cordatum TaxID=2364126 RepID=A0ABN9QA54_9DINO|nr:unnamed protein product [Polarella glacialis]
MLVQARRTQTYGLRAQDCFFMAAAANQAMTNTCGKEFQPPARVGIDTGLMGADLVRHAVDGAELVDEKEEDEGQGPLTSEEVEDQGRHRMARGRERQDRAPSPMVRVRVDGTPDLILPRTELTDVGWETRAMRHRQAQITTNVRKLVRAEQNRTVTMLERRLCGLDFKNLCRQPFADLPLVGGPSVGRALARE